MKIEQPRKTLKNNMKDRTILNSSNHLTRSAMAHVFYTNNVCVHRFTLHVLHSYVNIPCTLYIHIYIYICHVTCNWTAGGRFAACNWTTCHISVCNMLLQFDCTPFDIPFSINL